MIYLIIYDISDDKIRNKVAKRLTEASYERLQLSVFTGLNNPAGDTILWHQLTGLLEAEPEAKFYIFPVPKSSLQNMIWIGKNDLDTGYLTGDIDSLFI